MLLQLPIDKVLAVLKREYAILEIEFQGKFAVGEPVRVLATYQGDIVRLLDGLEESAKLGGTVALLEAREAVWLARMIDRDNQQEPAAPANPQGATR